MFAGFLGTAGLFHKPLLEIKSLEQQLEMVLNFLDVFKQHTNNLFILATRPLKGYAFVFLDFILFAGKEIPKIYPRQSEPVCQLQLTLV